MDSVMPALEAQKKIDEERKKLTDLETYLESKEHLEWTKVTLT